MQEQQPVQLLSGTFLQDIINKAFQDMNVTLAELLPAAQAIEGRMQVHCVAACPSNILAMQSN